MTRFSHRRVRTTEPSFEDLVEWIRVSDSNILNPILKRRYELIQAGQDLHSARPGEFSVDGKIIRKPDEALASDPQHRSRNVIGIHKRAERAAMRGRTEHRWNRLGLLEKMGTTGPHKRDANQEKEYQRLFRELNAGTRGFVLTTPEGFITNRGRGVFEANPDFHEWDAETQKNRIAESAVSYLKRKSNQRVDFKSFRGNHREGYDYQDNLRDLTDPSYDDYNPGLYKDFTTNKGDWVNVIERVLEADPEAFTREVPQPKVARSRADKAKEKALLGVKEENEVKAEGSVLAADLFHAKTADSFVRYDFYDKIIGGSDPDVIVNDIKQAGDRVDVSHLDGGGIYEYLTPSEEFFRKVFLNEPKIMRLADELNREIYKFKKAMDTSESQSQEAVENAFMKTMGKFLNSVEKRKKSAPDDPWSEKDLLQLILISENIGFNDVEDGFVLHPSSIQYVNTVKLRGKTPKGKATDVYVAYPKLLKNFHDAERVSVNHVIHKTKNRNLVDHYYKKGIFNNEEWALQRKFNQEMLKDLGKIDKVGLPEEEVLKQLGLEFVIERPIPKNETYIPAGKLMPAELAETLNHLKESGLSSTERANFNIPSFALFEQRLNKLRMGSQPDHYDGAARGLDIPPFEPYTMGRIRDQLKKADLGRKKAPVKSSEETTEETVVEEEVETSISQEDTAPDPNLYASMLKNGNIIPNFGDAFSGVQDLYNINGLVIPYGKKSNRSVLVAVDSEGKDVNIIDFNTRRFKIKDRNGNWIEFSPSFYEDLDVYGQNRHRTTVIKENKVKMVDQGFYSMRFHEIEGRERDKNQPEYWTADMIAETFGRNIFQAFEDLYLAGDFLDDLLTSTAKKQRPSPKDVVIITDNLREMMKDYDAGAGKYVELEDIPVPKSFVRVSPEERFQIGIAFSKWKKTAAERKDLLTEEKLVKLNAIQLAMRTHWLKDDFIDIAARYIHRYPHHREEVEDALGDAMFKIALRQASRL